MDSSRIWLERELSAFSGTLPEGSRVLDAGSGDQRYRRLFERHVYESADFEQVDKSYQSSTYVCDLSNIPAADKSYDAIIFTQVMEHLPEPSLVLAELHRIAKPGCRLFYSGPLTYEEHEVPFDFYRYTQFGVRHLFAKAGFEIDDIHWLEGYLAVVAHHLKRFCRHMPRRPSEVGGGIYGWLVASFFLIARPVTRLMASLASRADVRVRYTGAGCPLNYVALVRVSEKP